MKAATLIVPAAFPATQAGCVSLPVEHRDGWADRLDVNVEIWENWMWGTTRHNLTAYVKIVDNGTEDRYDVQATHIILESAEGTWHATPESWIARNGPEWPIGTLVTATIELSRDGEPATVAIPDVEVQAAY